MKIFLIVAALLAPSKVKVITCVCDNPNSVLPSQNWYSCTDGTHTWCPTDGPCTATGTFDKGHLTQYCKTSSNQVNEALTPLPTIFPDVQSTRLLIASLPPCGNGVVGNGRCSDSTLCCSQYGYCGSGSTYCTKPSLPVAPTAPMAPKPTPTIVPVQPGRLPTASLPSCGNGVIGNGRCSDSTLCCSQYGYCGSGSTYCTKPSPPVAPTAPAAPKPTPTIVPTSCGNGVVGNGRCSDSTLCCSQYGYCGSGSTYCTKPSPPVVPTAPVAPKPTPTLAPVPKPTPPSRPPTPAPSKRPTSKPSKPPTTTPSKPVTLRPSKPPTPTPSKSPMSKPPTPKPLTPSKPVIPTLSKPPTSRPSKPPTPIPLKTPTPKPSKPPISTPSKRPTPIPSKTPTSSPTSAPALDFKGLSNVYSIDKGIIQVNWKPPTFTGHFSTNVTVYDVFVADSTYDYNATLMQITVKDLIKLFEANKTAFQHFQVNNRTDLSIECPMLGQVRSVLVTAKLGVVYSTNKISTNVIVASSSPHIRDNVTVVGIFIPTLRVDIVMNETIVAFSGSVSVQAQNLVPGNIITGFSSKGMSFIRRVIKVTKSSPSQVTLIVEIVVLEDVFDELSLDGMFESSARNGVQAGRRLSIFDDIGNAFVNFGQAAVHVIGDAVTSAADFVESAVEHGIGGLLALVTGAEQLERFSIISINEKWTEPIVEDVVTLSASLDLEANLVVKFQIVVGVPKLIQVGLEASYAVGATLEITKSIKKEGSKEVPLFNGGRQVKVFFLGPVPVEVDYGQKVVLKATVAAELSVSSQVGASVSGSTSVFATYDIHHNPLVYASVTPPTFQPELTYPTVELKAELTSGVMLVYTADVELYGGLMKASLGLSAGVALDIAAGVTVVESNVIPTLFNFDLNLEFSIPLSATALYDAFTIADTTAYSKTWPIITLPSAELTVDKEFRCYLGGGSTGNVATLGLTAQEDYDSAAFISNGFAGDSKWFLNFASNGWSIGNPTTSEADIEMTSVSSFSNPPQRGLVTFARRPKIPPIPLYILSTFHLESLDQTGVTCTEPGPCEGAVFLDALTGKVGAVFNSQIFLSQPPDPQASPVPSTVYKFEDFTSALKKLLQAEVTFNLWLGDDCSVDSEKVALVNMATFLGQAMLETIIYDACDENNYGLWRADVFKEPTSPPQNLAAFYPMSAGCGQVGQVYANYRCDDECPIDLSMEVIGTTNARWIGAPPPLFCGPKSKYDGLGYWNPQKFCKGPGNSCENQPFSYAGQTAGVYVPVSEDNRFPAFFYTHPLPDANGVTPAALSPANFPATNVEGCCWWGRGVIQTTGRCNFGKLNKQLGAGAGANALYPDINFCSNPQSICNGPSDLKWVAGIFYWASEPQVYDRDGFNYKEGVKKFVEMGCADNPDLSGCDFLFEYASGIVNRGCHNPGTAGCPNCVPGATCGPALHVAERVKASKQALRALIKTVGNARFLRRRNVQSAGRHVSNMRT